MTKLIIQIPCLNEAADAAGDAGRPAAQPARHRRHRGPRHRRRVPRRHRRGRARDGVDHVVGFRRRKGLAAAFSAGIDAAVKLGADYIVNTDADNQYVGADIARLIEPLVRGDADIVIGDRNIQALSAYERHKETAAASRELGRPASVRHRGARYDQRVPRLHTRSRAAHDDRLGLLYTLESIIQAGKKRMAIAHVPIRTNPRLRPSRLFDSIWAISRPRPRRSCASTRCTSR